MGMHQENLTPEESNYLIQIQEKVIKELIFESVSSTLEESNPDMSIEQVDKVVHEVYKKLVREAIKTDNIGESEEK